jgi:hypothetical protein
MGQLGVWWVMGLVYLWQLLQYHDW